LTGKNRIDQRIPLKSVTDFLLPSKGSARSNGLKKLCCSLPKTTWQHVGQGGRSDQAIIIDMGLLHMEGLLFLIADCYSLGTP